MTEVVTSADGTRWFAQRIAVDVQTGGPTWMAARGVAIAIGDSAGVWLSRDGRHFARLSGSAGAMAGAFGSRAGDGSLFLVGAFDDGDEVLHLVRVARDGASEIVAEIKRPLGAEASDEAKVFLAFWHEANETLRVAFATEVRSFGPVPNS